MTTRRFNYTARERIRREDAAIALRTEGGSVGFAADIRLGEYNLPQDARVVVEAYKAPIVMRFDLGTIALPKHPASTALSEFAPPEGVKFRVKVLASEVSGGKLLAVADQITPQELDSKLAGQRSLITTEGAELGDVVWTLLLEEGPEAPRLRVNKELGDWRAIARSPHFVWLVYPEILRRVLTFVMTEAAVDEEDASDWRTQWRQFGARLPGVSPLPDDADKKEKLEWVDEAVQSFCRARSFRTRFAELLTGEAG
jgi:hypothetical protein